MAAKGVGQSQSTHPNEAHLAVEMEQALRQTFLSNSMPISPRRAHRIGQEVAAAFLEFLESEQEETARTYGQQLATEGLGHRSILMMTEALRRVCRESTNPATGGSVAGRYVTALLEGYMDGRETSLLQQQARTMQALERAQKQHNQ